MRLRGIVPLCDSSLSHYQGVNDTKNISNEQMTNVVKNLATFVDYIAMETSSPAWANILVQFDLFFRRLPTLLPNPCDVTPVLKIMIAVLKIPGLTSVKVSETVSW